MTRPARNLFFLLAFVIGAVLLAPLLPDAVIYPASAVGFALIVTALVVGKRFFRGRALMRQKAWDEAALAMAGFEKEQTEAGWRRAFSWLFAGIYTHDGVAIARNNLGAIRLEQRQLDDAEAHFRRALERDAKYAVPYANLAIIAALRGQPEQAEANVKRARELGFRRGGLQKVVRALLAEANVAVGSSLKT